MGNNESATPPPPPPKFTLELESGKSVGVDDPYGAFAWDLEPVLGVLLGPPWPAASSVSSCWSGGWFRLELDIGAGLLSGVEWVSPSS